MPADRLTRGQCPICGNPHPFASLYCSPACKRVAVNARSRAARRSTGPLIRCARVSPAGARCRGFAKRGHELCSLHAWEASRG